MPIYNHTHADEGCSSKVNQYIAASVIRLHRPFLSHIAFKPSSLPLPFFAFLALYLFTFFYLAFRF